MRVSTCRAILSRLASKKTILNVIFNRCSSRVYTEENLSLLELSFLLWATQGVKGIRGKKYATLRTVPCGGARHPFETYLLVRRVEGLKPGKYHYLPLENQLEYLGEVENIEDVIDKSLCDQHWVKKSSVVFYWSFVPYRTEWRYGIFSHRGSLVDMGHVGENLYLACSALNLGTCGIGAYDQNLCDTLFDLDGEEEYIIYTETVGTIRAEDKTRKRTSTNSWKRRAGNTEAAWKASSFWINRRTSRRLTPWRSCAG